MVALKNLYKKIKLFDGVIIETTGLADPGPVAQTFFLDDDIQEKFSLDGIITVADSFHILQRLAEEKPEGVENEALQQVAFADRILLNKTDLIEDKSELDKITAELKKINPTADVVRSEYSKVDPKLLIKLNSFSLERVLDMDPEFLKTDTHTSDTHDTCTKENHDTCTHDTHDTHHSHDTHDTHTHTHTHTHDSNVSSVSCNFEGMVNQAQLEDWIGKLIREEGANLYRYKGILKVAGSQRKFIFQGVGMLFNGSFSEVEWAEGEKTECRFVFIGKNLDKKKLLDGFMECKCSDTLRFKLGQTIYANVGTWEEGKIIKLWDQGNPYRIEIQDKDKTNVWGMVDSDDYVRESKP